MGVGGVYIEITWEHLPMIQFPQLESLIWFPGDSYLPLIREPLN